MQQVNPVPPNREPVLNKETFVVPLPPTKIVKILSVRPLHLFPALRRNGAKVMTLPIPLDIGLAIVPLHPQ